MSYADQIHDHRFPTLDSDPGAVARAHAIHGAVVGRDQSRSAEAFGDVHPVTDDLSGGAGFGESLAEGNAPAVARGLG
jgi:hypothetical protein